METAFVIWMIGTLPAIGVGLIVVSVVGLFATLFITAVLLEELDSLKKPIFIGIFFGFLLLIGGMVPNKETAYAMAAGALGQKIVENPKVQELGGDAVDVLSAYLKKTKEELENKK